MNLSEFLVKAKINTYASDEEGGERKLEDGTRELVYKEDGYEYRDRYFGSTQFIGGEIVWQNKKAIWGMNYYGGLISDKVDFEEIFRFIREVLRLVGTDAPFRGPIELVKDGLKYKNNAVGASDKFSGVEEIYFKDEKVYELRYHGGLIKNR